MFGHYSSYNAGYGKHVNGIVAPPAYNPYTATSPYAVYDLTDESTITESSNVISAVTDKSGNGHNISSVVGSPLSGTRTEDGLNAVDLDGASGLDIPSSVHGVANGANTVLIIATHDNPTSTPGSRGYRLFNGYVGDPVWGIDWALVVNRNNSFGALEAFNNPTWNPVTAFPAHTSVPNVWGMSFDGVDSLNVFFNGHVASGDTGAPAPSVNGLTIGTTFNGGVSEVWIWDRQLTAQEMNEFMSEYIEPKYASITWEAIPDYQFVWGGDSRTVGAGSSEVPAVTVPERTDALLSYTGDMNIINTAVFGRVTSTAVSNFDNEVGSKYNPLIDLNVYIINGFGINDFHAGSTFESVRDNIITLCNNASALGYTVVLTTTPSARVDAGGDYLTSAEETELDDYNAWVLASGSTYADVVIDMTDNANVSVYNGTYFSDTVHFNDAGQILWADELDTDLQALIDGV